MKRRKGGQVDARGLPFSLRKTQQSHWEVHEPSCTRGAPGLKRRSLSVPAIFSNWLGAAREVQLSVNMAMDFEALGQVSSLMGSSHGCYT